MLQSSQSPEVGSAADMKHGTLTTSLVCLTSRDETVVPMYPRVLEYSEWLPTIPDNSTNSDLPEPCERFYGVVNRAILSGSIRSLEIKLRKLSRRGFPPQGYNRHCLQLTRVDLSGSSRGETWHMIVHPIE